jgi:hypothetical protein
MWRWGSTVEEIAERLGLQRHAVMKRLREIADGRQWVPECVQAEAIRLHHEITTQSRADAIHKMMETRAG